MENLEVKFVRCLRNDREKGGKWENLTVGKTYGLRAQDEKYYEIVDDRGNVAYYEKDRFAPNPYLKIQKDGHTWFRAITEIDLTLKQAALALVGLYQENRDHPSFSEYKERGTFEGFCITYTDGKGSVVGIENQEVKERTFTPTKAKNILHEFFNSVSDASGSLEAGQQEFLESSFEHWVDNEATFDQVADILIRYMATHHHPHTSCLVDTTTAVVMEGIKNYTNEEYAKD